MKQKLGQVTSTTFSDSESEEDDLPRPEPMGHEVSFQAAGRTVHATRFVNIAGSPRKRMPQEDLLLPDVAPEATDDYDGRDDFVPGESFAFDDGHPADKGPRDLRDSDRPLSIWVEYDLKDFLDEIVRDEGHGDYFRTTRCTQCRTCLEQRYRCDECFTRAPFCKDCIVNLHRDNPLHIIRIWDNVAWVVTTLKSLGLRVQLVHTRGEICPGVVARTLEEVAAADLDSFCIVDNNAIHEVAVDFCTCGMVPPRTVQLLQVRLYPATSLRPRSAATFRVLRKFHMLSFESKCSAYEFYNALARNTNNTGNFQPQNRYSEFLRMTREWRHLQMLKRSGRAHMTGGTRNIEPGACALLCPACPQPGKNLPASGEWRSVPPEKRFLYALFLAIDTNFKMKRKQVSSEEADPGLNNGAAFFSEVKAYMEHVGKHWEMEQEKSRCVSHDAVDQPDREAWGMVSSGIGTVNCAWHNMKRPNGVGDLQKGERYINMDYMLWMSLAGYDDLVQLMISYDIVCQWHINIWRRLVKYKPELVQRAGERYYVWLIPKWHLPAHIEVCNILYSFNLTPFIGRTDGEAPEHGWAHANPLASSTKEMGPGSRRDKAVGEMVDAQRELVESEASLPRETLEPWKKVIELWELDPANPNPFNIAEKHASLQAIRGRIAEETKDAVEGDVADDVRGDLHASEMIAMGLQHKQQQQALAADIGALKNHAIDRQKTTMLERSNKLRRKIANWIKTQTDFQPSLATVRAADDQARATAAKSQPTAGVAVHTIALWLPSKQALTPGLTVKPSHARYEFDLREGQAHEALEEVRRLLLVRTHEYQVKDRDVEGVAGHTRARTVIKVLDEHIRRHANDYRAAQRALLALAPLLRETRWQLILKELLQDDVRGMPRGTFHDVERKKKKKKNRGKERAVREMSWIWRTGLNTLTAAASTSEEQARKATDEGLHVEWAKTRAKAHRWAEEVDLLEEEMRRTLVFLEWKAAWWRDLRAGRPEVEEPCLQQGLSSYAERQAAILDDMKARFERTWQDVPTWIEMGREGVASIRAEGEEQRGDDEEDEAEDTSDERDEPVPLAPQKPSAVSASLVEGSLLPTV
ncbi:hypothetical protein FB451DRAFT_1468738 [Mycena latifolia]|nr:hypothetical protein FB451DRAFT_1468738 [Mycena latifolia]